jgi:predicted enzyme related to lactoylglutathione lyase
MRNPHGFPIWYELLTNDAAGAKRFYDTVIGWTVGDQPAMPGMDYRMIDTGNGDFVGGLMPITDEMRSGGAKPTWLFYIGVDDVDATVRKITDKGGGTLMPPFDMRGVGRMAFVTDPQGYPFYVMRGESDEASTAYDRTGMGKCNWNELVTSDQEGANAFYADVFGWTYPGKMPMGEMGDYVFVAAGDTTFGATMRASQPGTPTGWQFYFRAPDIDAAAEKVKSNGGALLAGPMEVPGGDMIIVAKDPEGTLFGVVAPPK